MPISKALIKGEYLEVVQTLELGSHADLTSGSLSGWTLATTNFNSGSTYPYGRFVSEGAGYIDWYDVSGTLRLKLGTIYEDVQGGWLNSGGFGGDGYETRKVDVSVTGLKTLATDAILVAYEGGLKLTASGTIVKTGFLSIGSSQPIIQITNDYLSVSSDSESLNADRVAVEVKFISPYPASSDVSLTCFESVIASNNSSYVFDYVYSFSSFIVAAVDAPNVLAGFTVENLNNVGTGLTCGLYITNDLLAQGGGTVFPIYSLSSEISYFEGSIRIADDLLLETGNYLIFDKDRNSRVSIYCSSIGSGYGLTFFVDSGSGSIEVLRFYDTQLAQFTHHVRLKDDRYLYLGSDDDGGIRFNATDSCIEIAYSSAAIVYVTSSGLELQAGRDLGVQSGRAIRFNGIAGTTYIAKDADSLNFFYDGTEVFEITADALVVKSGFDLVVAEAYKLILDGASETTYLRGSGNLMSFYVAGTQAFYIASTVLSTGLKIQVQSGGETLSSSKAFYLASMGTLAGGGAYSVYGYRVTFTTSAQSLTSVFGLHVSSIVAYTTSILAGVYIGTVSNAAGSSGNVYGIYISNSLSSAGGGSVYAFYSAATEESYFAGDIALASGKKLILDGSGGDSYLYYNSTYLGFYEDGLEVFTLGNGEHQVAVTVRKAAHKFGLSVYGQGAVNFSDDTILLDVRAQPVASDRTDNVTGLSGYVDTGITYTIGVGTGVLGAIFLNSASDCASIKVGTTYNAGTGDAIGLYIANSITALGGTGYAIFSASTEASYFAGDLQLNGDVSLTPGKKLIFDGVGGTDYIDGYFVTGMIRFYCGNVQAMTLTNTALSFSPIGFKLKLGQDSNANILATSPDNATLIYDSTNHKLMFRAGGSWETVTSS